MPIAGASRAAVSCSFGFLNVLLLTGSKQALMNTEASGLKSLTVKFHPLLWFCNSLKQEVTETWSLGGSVLHTCIAASESRNANRKEEIRDDTSKQITGPEMSPVLWTTSSWLFLQLKTSVYSWITVTAQLSMKDLSQYRHLGLDEMRKMKQLSITNLDGGSALDRVSSQALNSAVTSTRFPLQMHFNWAWKQQGLQNTM